MVTCAAFCLSLLFAGTAQAEEEFPGWYASLISGSDRLALYSAARAGVEGAIPPLIYRTGGMHRGAAPRVIARDVDARPILYYATNFNGGIPGAQISLGGLDFTIDDESRAKSGIVAGASVSGGLVASYRRGSLLRLSFGSSAEWLTGEGLRRQQLGVSGCGQHHLGGWTWLDGCIGAIRVWRSYDRHVSQQNISLGPTVIYTAGGIDQQFGLRAKRIFHEDGPQNGLQADWIGAFSGIGAISIGLEWAEMLEGENTTLRGMSLGLVRPTEFSPVKVSLNYDETGGYRLAGRDRKDRTISLGVEMPVTEKIGLDATIGRRASTIDAYDESFWRFNVDLRDW
ncbi:hypothetical protein [Paracoccus methylarcula]|uniref:Autotransporter outer membrane beta-barrel domain-containing protein n=1 Tax=Paracoccus methylarcula TaxID=72022 RepID=A0A422R0M6_9RHOB|nr:hypothetical protein [Paracoccus methylarcula]RNF35744.1 hypothetical protein A7A09_005000 [Paracoccus methylarcula]